MISIREFTPEDYTAAFALWQNAEGVCLGASDTAEAIRQFLERNPGLSFVASDGGAMVGVLLCGEDGRRGYLHHLAVEASHRRRGIGTALVNRTMDALAARGLHKCHLFVVNGNAQAIEFWESAGWRVRGDIVMMSRVVEASAGA